MNRHDNATEHGDGGPSYAWAELSDQELEDDKSIASAEEAVAAWMGLPKRRRHDPSDKAACALFDVGFALLGSASFKQSLAQFGADLAIRDDDARALAGFMALGASFEPPKPSQAKHSNHVKTWEASAAHRCAKQGAFHCLELLLDQGLVARDQAIAAPLLEEPVPSGLRQIDAAFLAKRGREEAIVNGLDPDSPEVAQTLRAMQSGNDLLLALLGAQTAHSEDLAISIASAEVRGGNPLFVALALQSEPRTGKFDPARDAKLLALGTKLAAAGLLDAKLPSHREALLRLAFGKSEPAAELAIAAGLSPAQASEAAQRDMEKKLCNPLGLQALPPKLRELCSTWAADPGFGQRLFDRVGEGCRRAIEEMAKPAENPSNHKAWDQTWAFNRLQGLCKSWSHAARGFDAPSPDSARGLGAAIDAALVEWGPRMPPGATGESMAALRGAGEALGSINLSSAPSMRL